MDAVALTAVISSSVVGLSGVAVPALVAWRDRSHDRDSRRTERRADAYVEVLTMVATAGQWAQTVHPMIGTTPTETKLPPLDEQARIEALTGAFASMAVRKAYQEWDAALRAVLMEAAVIYDGDADPANFRGEALAARKRLDLDGIRVTEGVARTALNEAIGRDLGMA